jgi:hypothetical protein
MYARLITQHSAATSAERCVNVNPTLLARPVSAFVCSPVRGLFIRRVHAELLEIFHYAPDTGIFTRKRRTAACNFVGEQMTGVGSCGYVEFCINFQTYRAHRLAWLYVNGRWPVFNIDHINGAPLDNRLVNLRDVSQKVNTQNRMRARANSASGLIGANKRGARYRAIIGINSGLRHLGTFDTAAEAHAAYLAAKKELHPEAALSGCVHVPQLIA